MTEDQAVRRLEIVAGARAAWRGLAAYPGAALILAMPAACLALMARIVRPILWPGVPDAAMAENVIYFFVNMNLHLLAFAAAMPALAAWHRVAAAPDEPVRYRVSDPEWRYLWWAVGLFLAVYLAAIPASTLLGLMHGHLGALAQRLGMPAPLLQALSLPVYALAVGIVLRGALILPAVAASRPLKAAANWRRGRANTWRLAAAAGLTFAPVAVLGWALGSFAAPASLGPLVVSEMLNVVLMITSLYLAAGLLSNADSSLPPAPD